MVPAMTAREKIARAAAALVIEKAVPAVVPLGAGKATSAAGGQAGPGWDPAGIRNVAVIASVAGSGGRVIRAAVTIPGTARHAVTRLVIVSANRSVGVRHEAPMVVATTPAAVGGVADVTTGAPANAATATDARRNNGIGAATAGRIVTTAVAARNVATAVRADSAAIAPRGGAGPTAMTASLQPGRDRAASSGPGADGRARGGRGRAGVTTSVGPAGRVAPNVATAPEVGRTRAAPDARVGTTVRSGADGATTGARNAALAARKPAARGAGGTIARGAIGRHPPTGAGRTARTPGAGLTSASGVNDARRAVSVAGTVRAQRSAGSGVQKAEQKALAAGVPSGAANAGPAATGARSHVPTAAGATSAGSQTPATDRAAARIVRRPGSTVLTAVPVTPRPRWPSLP
jgi:hypothetical protein